MAHPVAKIAVAAAFALLLSLPATAAAAGAPQIGAVWITDVNASSATLHDEVNPEGAATTYRFEYTTDAAFQEKEFNGAAKAPAGNNPSVGSGSAFVTVLQKVSALHHATLYHYRLTATNGFGTIDGEAATFTTQELGGGLTLLDSRGFELVSPPDKNGGAIQGPEQIHGGGVIQADPSGEGEITYSSSSSFGGFEATGAPPASQYISRRSAAGWSTENITAPTLSGSYGNDPNGVPYQLFSTDLTRALMLNGIHCRGEGTGCPVANPPLSGSGAPPSYQDYYLRDNEDGSFTATVTEANAELGLEPEEFDLAFAGASPDLRHLVLSTCAALTPDAAEVPGSEGCDPNKQNLYEWSGGQLSLLNVAPGAALAAQTAAVSADGARVYFTEAGKLWLREGNTVNQVDEEVGGGSTFQAATPSGAFAFFTKGEHLYRYDAGSDSSADLTLSGGVTGILGASQDGGRVYYQDAAGLWEWHEGSLTMAASGPQAASPSDYPPATGTARVSPDGARLLFLSKESVSGDDNTDATTGLPDSEVFLYNAAGSGSLSCVSCNPTGERPGGPSVIAGAYSNGSEGALSPGQIVTDFYKPNNLSATANRAFFESDDSLVANDTNKSSDVYEWEAQGTGSCARPSGCLALISSGTDPDGASFLDASESGADAYFLTFSSLVAGDPGSADVYDARVGGGFPVPSSPIPCEGDACVPLPQGPEDPTVGSLISGIPNPPVHFPPKQCPQGTNRRTHKGHTVCLRHHKKNHRKNNKKKGGHR